MLLTLGADLYTVSKLLGHTSVKMTQVYAKIVNKKKDDAVNLTNGLFDRQRTTSVVSNLQTRIWSVSPVVCTSREHSRDILLTHLKTIKNEST